MKNTRIIHTILFSFLGASSSAFGVNSQVPSLKVILAALSNGSESPVMVACDSSQNKSRTQTVAPFEEKELKNTQIPFISVRQQDRDAFVGSDPYVPQGSLVISTKQGHFCMWEDERGVQGAFRFNPEDPAACPREVCINKKLYNSNVIRAAIVAGRLSSLNNQVNLRLFVNSLGHIERAERV